MTFSTFSQYLQKLVGVTGRLEITKVLAELFDSLAVDEVKPVCYLILGQLRPAYEGLEFQVASKMVIKAMARVGGSSDDQPTLASNSLFGEVDYSQAEDQIASDYKKIGDLGDVAATALAHQKNSTLSVSEVYQRLISLAEAHGVGSQDQKIRLLADLLSELDAVSAKFVIRMIMGKLRLGFSTMTVIDGLSWARTGGKADREMLETAWQKQTDIGHLAEVYLAAKSDQDRQRVLSQYTVTVGVPVVPALCQRLATAAEVIAKMTEVLVEPKYDGVRVQIHFRRGTQNQPALLRTFTRSLEESTAMFPELQQLADYIQCDECILDGEAIGYDPTTGTLKAFQETITRKRKHDVAETASAIPLRFFVFDILTKDGVSLIDKNMRDRKDELKNLFKENRTFVLTPYEIASTPEEIQRLHAEALAEGLEGVVMKQAVSPYQSGRKGWAWVKMKEVEGTRGKLLDTVDAVVMGYYEGRGKRTEFGLGAFLVGVLNENQEIVTLAKIGTGLSDDQFRELFQLLKPHQTTEKPAPYHVAKLLIPDMWVKPSVVVEVAADELTVSPQHTAGVALRFPRLIRFRGDKTWQQATTQSELKTLMPVVTDEKSETSNR